MIHLVHMLHWGSNPWPLSHESSPVINRPGLVIVAQLVERLLPDMRDPWSIISKTMYFDSFWQGHKETFNNFITAKPSGVILSTCHEANEEVPKWHTNANTKTLKTQKAFVVVMTQLKKQNGLRQGICRTIFGLPFSAGEKNVSSYFARGIPDHWIA